MNFQADDRWRIYPAGGLVALFCLLSAHNQWQMAELASRLFWVSSSERHALVFGFISVGTLAHVGFWFVATAVVAGSARLWWGAKPGLTWYRLLQLTGWAHIPLAVWAVIVLALTREWFRPVLSEEDFIKIAVVAALTRPFAYVGSGLWLSESLRDLLGVSRRSALGVVFLPIAALALVLTLLNVALGIAFRMTRIA